MSNKIKHPFAPTNQGHSSHVSVSLPNEKSQVKQTLSHKISASHSGLRQSALKHSRMHQRAVHKSCFAFQVIS